MESTLYRIYACGKVVHEDDFQDEDSTIPYTDDYSTHEILDVLVEHIEECMITNYKALTGQALVEDILRRAKDTNFGCDEPERSTEMNKSPGMRSRERN